MSPRQGGDSYPSGTPPYGSPSDPAFSRAGQGPQQGQAPTGDEPRTETTLTTRIKINIPGSRPIPPVVVRSPLNGEETGEQPAPRRHRAEASGSPVLGVMDSGTGTTTPPDLPAEWRTPQGSAASPAAQAAGAPAATETTSGTGSTPPSEWFAPRKKQQAGPTPTAPAQPAAAAPQQAPAGPPVTPAAPSAPSAPFGAAPRQAGQQQSGQQTQQQPAYPATSSPYDTQAGQAGQAGQANPWPLPGEQGRTGQTPVAAAAASPTLAPRPVPGGGRPSSMQQEGFAGQEPGAQQTLQFRAVTDPRPGQQPGAQGAPVMPGAPGAPAGKPGRTAKAGRGAKARTAAEQTAAMPQVSPFQASPPHAQQQPGGLPVSDGFAGGTGGAGAPPRPERGGEDAESAAPAGERSATPAKTAKPRGGKGRKLVGYAVGALVLVGGVAYGAGLMLNQTDVPKGTTVLGVAIGGDSRDQAVSTLDSSLGAIANRPMTLTIGGVPRQLNPSVAGLTIDTDATVDSVDQKSYNPVTVIGSLLGGDHSTLPVVKIDEEKLRSALQQLSTGGGASSNALIRFTADGKAVVTLPKAGGAGLNVDAAVPLVEQAFRNRAAGLPDKPVALAAGGVSPSKVSAAATTAAAQTLGSWAMSKHFEVVAGSAHVTFGKNTFSQALTLRPDASGQFVPVFNLTKLAAAYGARFAGAHTKDGKPVTAQEVATALTTLLSKPNGPTSITI